MSQSSLERQELIQVTRLWSKAHPVVEAMIVGAVVDFHDAEDIVASVAETVVTKFSDYDPARPFLPWALGIARNLLLRYFERRAKERCQAVDGQVLDVLVRAHQEIADEIPARLSALRKCMEGIKGKGRRVLEMRYIHGLKPEAIADALAMKRNAVWVMLHRVRLALKDCIESKLVPDSGGAG